MIVDHVSRFFPFNLNSNQLLLMLLVPSQLAVLIVNYFVQYNHQNTLLSEEAESILFHRSDSAPPIDLSPFFIDQTPAEKKGLTPFALTQ
jgi:hypothetical protein